MIIELESTDGRTIGFECEQVDDTPFAVAEIGSGLYGSVHVPAKRKLSDVEWRNKDSAVFALRKLWATLMPSRRIEIQSTNRPSNGLSNLVVETLRRSAIPAPEAGLPSMTREAIDKLGFTMDLIAFVCSTPVGASMREIYRGHLERALATLGPKPNQSTEVNGHGQ